MESAAGLIKLGTDHAKDLAEWRETLASRRDEVLQLLRNEGVAVESWFQIEVTGEPYLLWFMRAKSIATAQSVFANSEHEIDAYHLEKLMKIGESQIAADLLLDFSIDLDDPIGAAR